MRKNRKYTAEFKIEIVKKAIEENIAIREIARQEDIPKRNIQRWIRNYDEHGEEYFYKEHRGNGGGNPYAALHTSKNLSEKEKLELENLKLRIENERLKKGYMVKGVGANKEFVTTRDVNMK